MKFGIFYELQLPRPWGPDDERALVQDARSQVELADRLGLDYAWGHNSVQVFEQEALKGKKEFLGKIFAPTGTKDYSPYITKIRQSGADAVFLVLQGDDNNAFLSQSQQYRLPEKVRLNLAYGERATLWTDLRLIAITVRELLSPTRDGREIASFNATMSYSGVGGATSHRAGTLQDGQLENRDDR